MYQYEAKLQLIYWYKHHYNTVLVLHCFYMFNTIIYFSYASVTLMVCNIVS